MAELIELLKPVAAAIVTGVLIGLLLAALVGRP